MNDRNDADVELNSEPVAVDNSIAVCRKKIENFKNLNYFFIFSISTQAKRRKLLLSAAILTSAALASSLHHECEAV